MGVRFDQSKQHDRKLSQTVEGAFLAYGNWAGIHDYQFKSLVNISSVDVSPGSGSWSTHQLTSELANDAELTFTVQSLGFGAYFTDSTTSTLMCGVTESGYFEVWRNDELRCKRPVECPVPAKMVVSYRQHRHSDDEKDVWASVTIWANDSVIDTYTEYIEKSAPPPLQAGLASSASTAINFTDVRIPLLTDYTEWSSLDPGENPIGGLNRAIEGRYTRFFLRWDGSLLAKQKQPTSPVFDFSGAFTPLGKNRSIDLRGFSNHIRMLGAYVEAEFARSDLIARYGHRFAEIQNPYLMSELECYQQAERQIQRHEEQAQTMTIETHVTPLLEKEDHVTVDGEDWIVDSFQISGKVGNYSQQVSLRKYVYGS